MPTSEAVREVLDYEHTSVQQLRAVSDESLALITQRDQVMMRRDLAAASLAVYGVDGLTPWTNGKVREQLGLCSHDAWNAKATARLRAAFPITSEASSKTAKLWQRYGQVPFQADALSDLRTAVQQLRELDARIEQLRIERDGQMAAIALMFPTISLAQLSAAAGISRQAINLILRRHKILWNGTSRYSAAVRVSRSRSADT